MGRHMGLTAISYGGGVQSTALVVLAATGQLPFKVDAALFANVGTTLSTPPPSTTSAISLSPGQPSAVYRSTSSPRLSAAANRPAACGPTSWSMTTPTPCGSLSPCWA